MCTLYVSQQFHVNLIDVGFYLHSKIKTTQTFPEHKRNCSQLFDLKSILVLCTEPVHTEENNVDKYYPYFHGTGSLLMRGDAYMRQWTGPSLVQVMACHLFGVTWWRHQMEPFSALLALCAGNSPVPVISRHVSDAELWCFLWSAPE